MIQVDIEAYSLGDNIGLETTDELQRTANNGMYRYIKVKLPETKENDNNGEGCWAIMSSKTFVECDSDMQCEKTYKAVLCNNSLFFNGLDYGTIIPVKSRGNLRPVVPYEWLNENY